MRLRSRSFLRGITVALALTLAATISLAGQAQAPAKPTTAKAAPSKRRCREGLQGAAHARRPAGPAGVLDQLDIRAARAAEWCDQRDIHAGRSRSGDQGRRGTRSGADRAGDDRRRALRLQPVRTGSKPVHVREEPADVPDRGSAGREDSTGHRRRAEARAGSRRRTEGDGRSVRRGGEHADRLALHHHGRSRTPAAERRLQRELPDRPGRRAT